MAYTSVGANNLLWPLRPNGWYSVNNTAIDATAEASGYIGRVRWSDGGSHTIDTTGSSAIYMHTTATAVFDDVSSIMHIGIQDVDVTTGHPARPDLAYDVHAVVTTAANTTPALTTVSSLVKAVPTAGTKTIANGALVAVLATFDTRAGSDSVGFMRGFGHNGGAGGDTVFPMASSLTTGSWATSSFAPCVLLVASDGTFGTIDGSNFIGESTTATYNDSSGTDEYGQIFQVPFACKVDGFTFSGGLASATSDFQYDLTSDPTGTPASLISGPVAVPAESVGGVLTAGASYNFMFPSEITLAANTDYCISVKATGAGNVTMYGITLPDANARALFPGGTNTRGATRNGGSGAYTASTTVIRAIAVRISSIDFPSGGGTYFSVGG